MAVIGKVTPKVYEYLRALGKSSILETKPLTNFNPKGLIFDFKRINAKDGVFKVTERVKHAHIQQHYDEGGTIAFGYMPNNYVNKTMEFVPESSYVARFGPKKGQKITTPAHFDEVQTRLPHYHIDKLWTNGKGTGTRAVQEVVEKSVADARTCGRVTLDAKVIDGKTCPAGFYYKLGFRFGDSAQNQRLEQWLLAGGKREANICETGMMFLPKENIEHCLNYGKKNI